MPQRLIDNELYIFITKIIFPSFLAICVKIALEMKNSKNKITLLNVTLSMIIGISGAYFSSGFILNNFETHHVPIAIAVIAMTSEKICGFIIYKLNVDAFLTAIFEGFFEYLSNIFKIKK